uniref:NADH-ubiquinone oxidoreductase chain 5 n=1 Tax=Zyginella minuta TaxID=2769890 RepID=A0A7H0DHZ4_9HEMI|nr:NADH dehydrogenase subunit 5 [Zyginella minuta]QNP08954.1 NADH dehydrogenase subunit 5 [Zyginella minuta]
MLILYYSLFFFFFFFFFVLFLINDYCILLEWGLFNLNSFEVCYLLVFDWISLIFISVVIFISSMVILYSCDYMGVGSYSSIRFLFLVVSFVFSMLLMIMSPNLLSILLGWDGLGLVSYCLVIYYSSTKSYLAGMITCLTNRLGDIGLLISICWLMSYGSWHFMFYLDYYSSSIFYLLIISAFTKSAQIPFSSWLPAAMAAPTPVSSLVHSSTLVTAGVYLLIRLYQHFNYNNYLFLFLGLLTMFMSSFCANHEFDLKKVIALSTLSQLGLMVSSLFLGLMNLSFFHLLTHAMFKSLLFLCAGIMIFYMNDNQDIRIMGSVSNFMPFTVSCFNISNMALCGIPFLSGFYSKDLIVELMNMNYLNFIVFILFYVCLGMTVCYSVRLFYYSVLNNYKFISMSLFFEDLIYMKISIFCLTFFSVFFGGMMMWMLTIDLIFIILPLYLKLLSLLSVFLGFWLGSELSFFCKNLFNSNYYFFTNMWFMSSYFYFMYDRLYSFSNNYSFTLNWGEFYGSMGLSYYLLKFSNFIQNYSLVNMKMFLLSFFVWFFVYI